MLRIGTDIGGTFTDVTILNEDTGEATHTKVLTTARRPADAIVATLDEMGIDLGQTRLFSHGSTVAINAVVQGTGARTGVIATRGFRDTLELRRGARTHILDPLMDKPDLFVPRRRRIEVNERVLADGTVESPLDEEELAAAVQKLVDDGVVSVAVCFQHSYAYPEHERQAGAVIARRFPDLPYTLSSDIVPEIKEFERTSTAVLNAYVRPVVKQYLDSLESKVTARGLAADVHLMQSNGGLITAGEATLRPISILESGPAGGSIAAAHLGARIGVKDIITFDMGGTTAKSSVIEDGEPLMTLEYELFEEHDKPGSGWPLRVPMIDIVEIGAGGGSIAWLDEAGRLQVGPRSAGSEPGPVCYGRGGTEPTITDAHAVLGNIRHLLGGGFALDVEGARKAVEERIAGPLGLSVEQAAAGILQIASAKVADLIREVTVARGRDPRRFALVGYGGMGPLEIASVLTELNVPLAIIPPTPGTFSALGLIDADIVTDTARTLIARVDALDPAALATMYQEMSETLLANLARQGIGRETVKIDHYAELRYRGQFHQVIVPLDRVDGSPEMISGLSEKFHAEHLRLYTYESRDEALEVVNLRARATGPVERVPLPVLTQGDKTPVPKGQRPVRFRYSDAAVDCAIYDRARLGAGVILNGPAVIEEYTSTTLVPAGFTVEVDQSGNLLLRTKP